MAFWSFFLLLWIRNVSNPWLTVLVLFIYIVLAIVYSTLQIATAVIKSCFWILTCMFLLQWQVKLRVTNKCMVQIVMTLILLYFTFTLFWSPWKTSDFVVVKSPVRTTSHSLPQWPESTHRELHLPSTDRSSLSSYKDDIDQWCWHCAYERQEVKKC